MIFIVPFNFEPVPIYHRDETSLVTTGLTENVIVTRKTGSPNPPDQTYDNGEQPEIPDPK